MATDFRLIGDRIKQARLNKKITQEKLAEMLDVSTTFLSRVERGCITINVRRLSQICTILGVSESYILDGTNNTSVSYLSKEFSDLFKNCPSDKISLIYNIAKMIIEN